MSLAWRAYYSDARVYTSARTQWAAMPDDGLLIVILDGDNHRILQGTDWYFHVAPDVFGQAMAYEYPNQNVPESIARRYPGAMVKRGMDIGDAEFKRVLALACPPPPTHKGCCD